MHGRLVEVKDRKGNTVRLLNPAQKADKFLLELKGNVHLTNYNKSKLTKSGKVKRLSDTQRSFRSGYLAAMKDSARAYKHNKNKGKF